MGNCQREINSKDNVEAANFKIDVSEKMLFDETEIKLIQSSWCHVTDHKELGVKLMLRLFMNHSDLKDKFIFANSTVLTQRRKCVRTRS
jgi:hypothetical protein